MQHKFCSLRKMFGPNAGKARRASRAEIRAANRQTVNTPKAPGSESNFTGLPEDDNAIPVTTPVTSRQMQV